MLSEHQHSTATEHALDDVTCIAFLIMSYLRGAAQSIPEHQHSTATEHALDDVIVGVTIAFSVLCNDDCYRASLAMHTDAASLSNSATLLQSMHLRA